MATGHAVLPLQDVPHRDDVIGVGTDDRRVHGRALRRDLPSNQVADHVDAVTCHPDHHRRLDIGGAQCTSVSAAHEDLLLRHRSGHERADTGFADLQHPARVAAPDAVRVPGVHLPPVHHPDGIDHLPVRADRHDAPAVGNHSAIFGKHRLVASLSAEARHLENAR